MAFSPSSPSASLPVSGAFLQHHRHSSTPPLNQPISKRDKRRNATMERLNDITTAFNVNRDTYSKNQLNSLSRDMNYITRANVYQPHPLEDTADDIFAAINNSITDVVSNGMRGGALMNGFGDMETRTGSGKWSAIFTQEINNAMEERDADLTQLMIRHQEKVESLYEEHQYLVKVAEQEHSLFEKSIRERVIRQVTNKKAQMLREKEQLNEADTNALLLHPSQFSITHPGSPGGASSNRKTRNTRYRTEIEDPERIGDSKRKRKAPADFDTGSPAPLGRILEQEGTAWEKSQGALEYQQQHLAPLMSIDRLFPPKDLSLTTQLAFETAAQSWPNKRPKTQQTDSNGDTSDCEITAAIAGDVNTPHEMDGTHDEEENAFGHVEMDRTASQMTLRTMTRSTRSAVNLNSLSSISLGDSMATGRAAALGSIAAYAKIARSRDTELLSTPMPAEEIASDFAAMGIVLPVDDRESKRSS